MAMTSAEKQRAYRERHLGVDGGKVQVELVLDAHAAAQPDRGNPRNAAIFNLGVAHTNAAGPSDLKFVPSSLGEMA